jgi:hypothetical protein
MLVLAAGEAVVVEVAVDDEAAVVEGAVVEELDDELELHPPISSAMTATATPPAAMRELLRFSTCGPYLSPGRGAGISFAAIAPCSFAMGACAPGLRLSAFSA